VTNSILRIDPETGFSLGIVRTYSSEENEPVEEKRDQLVTGLTLGENLTSK